MISNLEPPSNDLQGEDRENRGAGQGCRRENTYISKRSCKPFVAVDCGLLSKELAAPALFGHEKGAFTGADIKRKGYWEEADGGTLFLDEIGNLPPEVQQMMLRALESKRYRPVGSNKDMAADVRIIAATNEDMQSAVAEKRFRQDLFHRIKEYTLP